MKENTIVKPINRLSVIVVTYNSSNRIRNLLDSLQQSLNIILEIFIIENNSKDANLTKQVCIEYQDKFKNIICYVENNSNLGFGKACNIGASLSKGKYLLFINPDTEIERDSLIILLNHAIANKADLIGGLVKNYDGEKHNTVVRAPTIKVGIFEFSNLGKLFHFTKWNKYFYYRDSPKVYNSTDDVEVDAIGGAYLMISRSVFNKLKGFDESFFMYLEDVDLGIRANTNGYKVVYCPSSIIKHVGGASSNNPNKIHHQAWYNSRRTYFYKHFGKTANILIQPIFILDEVFTKFIKRL